MRICVSIAPGRETVRDSFVAGSIRSSVASPSSAQTAPSPNAIEPLPKSPGRRMARHATPAQLVEAIDLARSARQRSARRARWRSGRPRRPRPRSRSRPRRGEAGTCGEARRLQAREPRSFGRRRRRAPRAFRRRPTGSRRSHNRSGCRERSRRPGRWTGRSVAGSPQRRQSCLRTPRTTAGRSRHDDDRGCHDERPPAPPFARAEDLGQALRGDLRFERRRQALLDREQAVERATRRRRPSAHGCRLPRIPRPSRPRGRAWSASRALPPHLRSPSPARRCEPRCRSACRRSPRTRRYGGRHVRPARFPEPRPRASRRPAAPGRARRTWRRSCRPPCPARGRDSASAPGGRPGGTAPAPCANGRRRAPSQALSSRRCR